MYSGFFRRLIAYIIDLFVLYIAILPFAFLVSKVLQHLGYYEEQLLIDKPFPLLLILGYVWLPIIVAMWVYFTTFEKSKFQSTLGKMILGIIVVDLNHDRISFAKASKRCFLKILLSIVVITCVLFGIIKIGDNGLSLNSILLAIFSIIAFFGFIVMVFNSKKQTIYDLILGTLVVKKSLINKGK